MDRKIRVSFFPANASKVRALAISRRSGLIIATLGTLASLTGFWLLFSGALHESPEKTQTRKRLEGENATLRERVESLENEADEVQRGLKHLEGLKVDALLATGMELTERRTDQAANGIWDFFQKIPSEAGDPAGALLRARSIALFYDSTLVVLQHAQEESESFPTGLPVPRSAILTRTYGLNSDPFTGKKALHPGVDFSDKPGTPILASGAGEVVDTDKDDVWGRSVKVRHRTGMETFYGHLATIDVKKGQRLKRGEMLGTMGESGQSTGPHLHFELRLQGERVDPLQYLLPQDAGSKWL